MKKDSLLAFSSQSSSACAHLPRPTRLAPRTKRRGPPLAFASVTPTAKPPDPAGAWCAPNPPPPNGDALGCVAGEEKAENGEGEGEGWLSPKTTEGAIALDCPPPNGGNPEVEFPPTPPNTELVGAPKGVAGVGAEAPEKANISEEEEPIEGAPKTEAGVVVDAKADVCAAKGLGLEAEGMPKGDGVEEAAGIPKNPDDDEAEGAEDALKMEVGPPPPPPPPPEELPPASPLKTNIPPEGADADVGGVIWVGVNPPAGEANGAAVLSAESPLDPLKRNDPPEGVCPAKLKGDAPEMDWLSAMLSTESMAESRPSAVTDGAALVAPKA